MKKFRLGIQTNRNVNHWHNNPESKYWRGVSWQNVLGADPEQEIDQCFERDITPSDAKEYQFATRRVLPILQRGLKQATYSGSGVQDACSTYSFAVSADSKEEVESVGELVIKSFPDIVISFEVSPSD